MRLLLLSFVVAPLLLLFICWMVQSLAVTMIRVTPLTIHGCDVVGGCGDR